jgi:hypothetical protein
MGNTFNCERGTVEEEEAPLSIWLIICPIPEGAPS